MPVTTYTDLTTAVVGIGDRTDATGVDVDDLTAEELRLVNTFHVEGAQTTNAFKVAAQSSPDMTVKVGSGTAKSDVYVVAGDYSGQGNYIVRMQAASVNVTISASEPAAIRTDEVYLVVLDAPYDGNTLGTASAPISLPRLAYRKGDAGGAAPGPDALWDAYTLLATIDVAAAVTTITNSDITDERTDASFAGRLAASPTQTFSYVGTYTGDGTNPRTIPLSFTPSVVMVNRTSSLSGSDPLFFISGFGTSAGVNEGAQFTAVDFPNTDVEVSTGSVTPTTNGFIVRGPGFANENTITYRYVAFR